MLLSSLVQVLIAFSGAVAAVNLTVASTGGNVSSPLQYGLMFEVRLARIMCQQQY